MDLLIATDALGWNVLLLEALLWSIVLVGVAGLVMSRGSRNKKGKS